MSVCDPLGGSVMVILGPKMGWTTSSVSCPRNCPSRAAGCSSDLEDMERFQCHLIGGYPEKQPFDEEASEEEVIGALVGA